jgi:hypothetical protein
MIGRSSHRLLFPAFCVIAMAAAEENIIRLFLNGCACDTTAEQLKTERTSITRVIDECVGTNGSGA